MVLEAGETAVRVNRRTVLSTMVALGATLGSVSFAAAQDTIKVGVLHSLSGTMAISETTLKDVMLMLVEEQNKKGGLLGKKLEAVVVDPASNWPSLRRRPANSSPSTRWRRPSGPGRPYRVSRAAVVKELNHVFFYPVQYEGEESERNVFYTGAAPNQQAIPPSTTS
jgi:urea transport system substrate-binding protein